jgi:hypothetical protein
MLSQLITGHCIRLFSYKEYHSERVIWQRSQFAADP